MPFHFFVVWEDHPRMGGEKLVCQPFILVCKGSPPHGRGKAKIDNSG